MCGTTVSILTTAKAIIMADFSNTKIILHELEQLFNRDDDIKDILDIKKMQTEIELHSAARLKDAKQLIKGEITALTYTFCASDSTKHLFLLYREKGGQSTPGTPFIIFFFN